MLIETEPKRCQKKSEIRVTFLVLTGFKTSQWLQKVTFSWDISHNSWGKDMMLLLSNTIT